MWVTDLAEKAGLTVPPHTPPLHPPYTPLPPHLKLPHPVADHILCSQIAETKHDPSARCDRHGQCQLRISAPNADLLKHSNTIGRNKHGCKAFVFQYNCFGFLRFKTFSELLSTSGLGTARMYICICNDCF